MTDDPLDIAEVALEIIDGSLSETTSRALLERPGLVRELEGLRAILQAFGPVNEEAEPPVRPAPPSPTWGPFTLQEEVGRGGFGIVCRGFDAAVDREIAVKLYRGQELPSEPRLMARVRHANVVTVYGAAVHDGKPGIWMEFIHGRTLAERVEAEGPLPVAETVRIGVQLCGALAAVHRAELVHQDVKPRNVMEENGGRIVLMDFGAGVSPRDGSGDNRLAGTPLYMAPEVVLGAMPSAQSDIYGVGVLLFYLLTGTYPVYATGLDELRRLHERQPDRRDKSVAVMLRELRPGVSGALTRALARALAPATRRYQTPSELEEALARTQRPAWPRSAVGFAAAAAVIAAVWLAVPRAPQQPPVAPAPALSPTPAVTPAPTPGVDPSPRAVPMAANARALPAQPTATEATPPWGVLITVVTRTAPPRHEPSATATPDSSPTEAPPVLVATLVLKIKPWAEVSVDGTPQGKSAQVILPPGVHRLTFSHPDYQPLKRAVTLSPGETKTLAVDLRDEAVKIKH